MGKVKATELEEVRIDFVSFVDRGANGQKFEIFKSADYQEETEVEESFQLSKEEASIFKKMIKFFTKQKDEEELSMADIDKIMKAIDGVSTQVKSIGDRLDKVEEMISKEDDLETQEEGTQDGSDGTTSDEGQSAGGDTATAQKGDGEGEEGSGDDDAGEEEVTKAMSKLSEQLKGIDERLSSIENVRKERKGLDTDTTVEKGSKEVSFAGLF